MCLFLLKDIILPWIKVDSFGMKSSATNPSQPKKQTSQPWLKSNKGCGCWIKRIFKTEIDGVNNDNFAAQYRALCGLKTWVGLFVFSFVWPDNIGGVFLWAACHHSTTQNCKYMFLTHWCRDSLSLYALNLSLPGPQHLNSSKKKDD